MILSTEVRCPECGKVIYVGNATCPYDHTPLHPGVSDPAEGVARYTWG